MLQKEHEGSKDSSETTNLIDTSLSKECSCLRYIAEYMLSDSLNEPLECPLSYVRATLQ